MMTPNFNLLYVADVARARAFYQAIFEMAPVEESPGFALFVLPGGLKFGLWRQDTVVPSATSAGGFELGLPVEDSAIVDTLSDQWRARGIAIIQEPQDMDFGRTFTATDPDGHRLRVFCPAER